VSLSYIYELISSRRKLLSQALAGHDDDAPSSQAHTMFGNTRADFCGVDPHLSTLICDIFGDRTLCRRRTVGDDARCCWWPLRATVGRGIEDKS
jgi:hypothetical protein